MAAAAYSVSGVSKWFGQIIAINDLTLESNTPVVGLLGPNGAGKSTLIKLLTGQIRPSRGQVRVFGEDPWNNIKLMARLGYCPEHDRFYEDLTVLQFVALLTRLQGYAPDRAHELAQAAIEQLELDSKRDAPISTLSHGMRQKVKLAQAIAHKPDWLLLDEPLSGLDPVSRAKVIVQVRALAESGAMLLVSSHVLHELQAMTSDILLLNKGRLVAQGQVSEIRKMIDAHPHRIALSAARPRELGRELLKFDDVARVEVESERIVIETRSPDACYSRIGELAASGDFPIDAMYSLDDNLEAVFRYLVK
jgi:ABC-2 type transport system ATP-binding protein